MALLIDYKIFFIGSIRVVLISDTHDQHETNLMTLLIDCKIFFISSIRVVLISDTHSQHERLGQLPHGDLLIHAGIHSSSSTFKVWQIPNFDTN